ncbi:MAG: Terminase [Bacteriophage sp.]|nr:MAG: Terminase [Bacteriophage sp.]
MIARKKSTWLSSTVWTDFKNILLEIGLYNVCRINNTLKTIQMYSTSFEFVGLDDVQRLHGLTTDIFWINEAMEASKDDFDQLEQRCARFSVLDYNPSAEEHWIYENVCPREDCFFDHSTMLDNPFIPANMRRKIESYEPTEYNYSQGTADKRKWLIYGLGKRAKIEGLIFENYTVIKEIPIWVKRRWYGLDFGYTNDPTACSENGFLDNAIYIDEKFYRTNMLSSDIIKEFKRMPKLNIWSESADPRLIAEIYNAGFNIRPVNKYHGSVEAGIDFMKSKKIYITEGSINAKKELDNYTYQQDKNGKWLNIPVDDFNHIIDEVRYCCMMELMGRKSISKGLEAFNH